MDVQEQTATVNSAPKPPTPEEKIQYQKKGLTLEERRKRWPLEYQLRDIYAQHLVSPSKKTEATIYNTLVTLAKVIIAHKYGTTSRLDYDHLPHEIATSAYCTIVMRRKEVYSWTNLFKKIVNDNVSKYLRQSHYSTTTIIDIESYLDGNAEFKKDNPNEQQSPDKFFDSNEIRPEDLIYLDQLLNKSSHDIVKVFKSCRNIKHYLIARMVWYYLSTGNKHKTCVYLNSEDQLVYNWYKVQLQYCIRPLIRVIKHVN